MAQRERFLLDLPAPLRERLDAYTERTGLKRSEVIRTALHQHLTAEEKKMSTNTNRRTSTAAGMGDHDYRRWQRKVWDMFNAATDQVDFPTDPRPWYLEGMSAEDAAEKLIAAEKEFQASRSNL